VSAERSARTFARRRLRLAWLALAWEALWPALWPAAGVVGLFLVLALADVLPLLPGWLHALILVGLAAGLVRAGLHGAHRLRLPDAAAAQRRLERDSGFEHRPLTALDDDLAAGTEDPAAAALWQHHRARALAALKRLRVTLPRPGLARHDRLALRIALGTGLVAAVIAAGGAAPENVARALSPTLTVGAPVVPPTLEVWVTPPEHTALPPVLLTGAAERDDVVVPGGSVVLAQVHDGQGQPAVSFGEAATAMAAVDDRTWRAEVTLKAEGADTVQRLLSVSQGEATLGAWPVAVVPDRAPEIAFAEPPEETQRTALRLVYAALDDHGLDSVAARIVRPAEPDDAIVLPLPLPGRGLKEARATSYHDLTAHPWAGLDVEIVLEATDGPGQVGRSEPLAMALPERIFTHPVARAIIAQRKRLTVEPDQRLDIAREIAKIGIVPERYDHDLVVYLSLMTSRSRLVHDDTDTAVPEVQGLLWETGLRVEEGRVSMAERRLRELQRELMEALNNDAPDAELERIMDELQKALEEFMQALNEQLQRQLEQGVEPMDLPPNAQLLQQQDLQEMLDRMREMMRMGARDAARQVLSQLQELLENLRSAPMQAMRQQQQSQAGQMLSDLQELMRRQQELLDQTFRESQGQRQQGMPQQGMPQQGMPQPGQRQPGQQPGEFGEMGAAEQEALRRMLGELMRQLGEMTGEIPDELGRAERFMRDSREALGQGQPGESIGPQTNALDQLQQGAQQMLQQMLAQQPGEGRGNQFGRFTQQQRNTDPLGRPLDNTGAWDDGNVAIPEEADLQRAREILNELRRRAGERQRPTPEFDYIDRLLRRF